MERTCITALRRLETSINWGLWAEAGKVARLLDTARLIQCPTIVELTRSAEPNAAAVSSVGEFAKGVL